MAGTGLDMGYMEFQFLEHKLDQTVLISGTLKQGSSFFNQKIFYFKKNFSYICDVQKWGSRISSREKTHMDPQLTGSDVVTTEDGHLLTLNQVMELKKQKIEHVEAFIKEHKFKPIIMKKIEWSTPARPAIREDYFSSLIGPEVEPDKVVELVNKMQERVDSLDDETASHISSVLLEMVKVVNEATGMRQLLTKREALLVCMGFKTGEAYVRGKYGINE